MLANQAFNAFSAFDEDAVIRIRPDQIAKAGQVPKNANVFITIFQTFMSGSDDDGNPTPYFGEYPSDFFDLVIVDECHRGGASDESQWRAILEHFSSAVQLGLTATPRRDENVDTYDYFGEPVYVYSLKEGINDGFLTPFRVKQISSNHDEYTFQPGDQVIAGDIDPEHTYTEKDFNTRIQIRSREVARANFMDQMNPNDKTLEFYPIRLTLSRFETSSTSSSKCPTSATAGHCRRRRSRRAVAVGVPRQRQVDSDILTTSEKLSTGVDALNIQNIVLLRPINR